MIASDIAVGLQDLSMAQSTETALYARLRVLAEEAGYSMNRLGQAIGKSSAAMRKWRLGIAKPTLATRKKLAQVLKRPLDELLDLGMEGVDAEEEDDDEDFAPGDAYRSLSEFVAEHPDLHITDEELFWLSSQKFTDDIGDAGDHEWWISQLVRYRGLMSRRSSPLPGGTHAAKVKRPSSKQVRG